MQILQLRRTGGRDYRQSHARLPVPPPLARKWLWVESAGDKIERIADMNRLELSWHRHRSLPRILPAPHHWEYVAGNRK